MKPWRLRRALRHVTIAILAALGVSQIFAPGRADAGVDRWTTNGPFGGQFSALAVDPSTPMTVYAGTGGTLLKSIDGGSSWTGRSPPIGFLTAFIVASTTPSTLYVATSIPPSCIPCTATPKLFKSTDGGATWTDISFGVAIRTFAVDPTSPTTMYAGGTSSGVYKTTNSGASWTPMNSGLPIDGVTALAVDPATPTTVYTTVTPGPTSRSSVRRPGSGSFSGHSTGARRRSGGVCPASATSRSHSSHRPVTRATRVAGYSRARSMGSPIT